MIPDVWMHFIIMLGLVISSIINKSDRQFIYILCIYAVAWQVSGYLSDQPDSTAFFKIFFQSAVSIAIIDSIVKLKYTRFTSFFGALLFMCIGLLFVMFMLDSFATNSVYNYAVDVFSLLNIQLIYLDLLALAGITFDMGSGGGNYRKSFKGDLYRSINPFGAMGRA